MPATIEPSIPLPHHDPRPTLVFEKEPATIIMKLALPIVALVAVLPVAGACSNWPGSSSNDTPLGGAYQIDDTSGALGSSCGSTTACNTGLTCVTTAPGGVCTKVCQSNSDCNGGICVWYPPWGGLVCFRSCVSDQLCRPLYRCQSTGTDSVCAPGAAGADAG